MDMGGFEPDPAVMNAAIMEVLDNQLRDGKPPETKATYGRLLAEGIDREEVRRLIACVIAVEIFEVMNSMQPFNQKRLLARLELLPEMPWLDE